MAVAPTGAIYKALKFDGVSSRTYGVYITGEAVYNAPERDVEMITIPGRNGSFALDNGRFENIEVSYPAGIFAETEADFRAAISDFRNFLCSRNGYVRLQDEYNPDEYRMAVYKSGLEVTPAMLKAGEFEITFDCKPQRWLTSGETEVTIANSGDTITNPTLFESSPMLEAWGYGTINIGTQEIILNQAYLGKITILNEAPFWVGSNYVLDESAVNIGDEVTISAQIQNNINVAKANQSVSDMGSAPDTVQPTDTSSYFKTTQSRDVVTTKINASITLGTSTTLTNTASGSVNYRYWLGSTSRTAVITYSLSQTLQYDASTGKIKITCSGTSSTTDTNLTTWVPYSSGRNITAVADSTISILGTPTYIDCDLGEAYMIESGTVISLNQHIDLGSNLPVLSSGSNTITFDNTITQLKVVPRWWKI